MSMKVLLPDGETTVFDTSNKTLKVQSGATPSHSNVIDYTFLTEPTEDFILEAIPHGYTYEPMALVFWSTDNSTFYMMPARINSDISGYHEFTYETNETELRIMLHIQDAPPFTLIGNRYYFKYYITTEDGVTN